MAGSVRPKHSGWEITVSAGRDPGTGRRRRVSRYVAGTRRDAERALARLYLEVVDGPFLQSSATLRDLVETWLPIVAVRLSPKTIYDYERILERILLPALGDVRLDELHAAQLDRLYARLLQAGPKGQPLSPNSVRKVHAVLRAALQQALKWGWVNRNVAHMATPPPQRRPNITSPAVADVRQLVSRAAGLHGGPDFAELLWLAAVTGARRGELCGLQWDDVDPQRGVLLIRRAVCEVDSELVVRLPKTHQGRRLALDDGTFEMLRLRRLRLAAQALAAGAALEPWVFPSTYGVPGPRAPESVSRQFRHLCREVGVQVRFHDLRHFAATEALDAGIPLPTVSKRLGHRDTSTTANIYAHATTRADREAAEVLGSLMRRELGGALRSSSSS
jgi:integrase